MGKLRPGRGSAKKAYLVGDSKISLGAVHNSVAKGSRKQWKRIRNFAKRYQYVPAVLYITAFDTANAQTRAKQLADIRKRDFKDHRVIVYVLSLL